MPDAAPLLAATQLLDYRAPTIVYLTESRNWLRLPQYDRIGAIYDFVRNEIAFGNGQVDTPKCTHDDLAKVEFLGQVDELSDGLLAYIGGRASFDAFGTVKNTHWGRPPPLGRALLSSSALIWPSLLAST